MVVVYTLDTFVIALDAKTGKEVWIAQDSWLEKGETNVGPVLVPENLVIAGFGGDGFAVRPDDRIIVATFESTGTQHLIDDETFQIGNQDDAITIK